MKIEMCKPESIREAFRFLIEEFGYQVERDEEPIYKGRRYAYVIQYQGNDRRVNLNYDYKENFLYFKLIRGLQTKFPSDLDQENIKAFGSVFKVFAPELDLKTLQPTEQNCEQVVRLNARLLREYCGGILRGEEWV